MTPTILARSQLMYQMGSLLGTQRDSIKGKAILAFPVFVINLFVNFKLAWKRVNTERPLSLAVRQILNVLFALGIFLLFIVVFPRFMLAELYSQDLFTLFYALCTGATFVWGSLIRTSIDLTHVNDHRNGMYRMPLYAAFDETQRRYFDNEISQAYLLVDLGIWLLVIGAVYYTLFV